MGGEGYTAFVEPLGPNYSARTCESSTSSRRCGGRLRDCTRELVQIGPTCICLILVTFCHWMWSRIPARNLGCGID